MTKTIAILTAGGDAPGMNACIRAIVRTALFYGIKPYGVKRAYAGLVAGDFRELSARDVGGILHTGGTMLQTARLVEFHEERVQLQAIAQLQSFAFDALVVIGGDGSLTGARAIAKHGFPVIGIPASIDNDIYGTDMSIGADTAVNTVLAAIDSLRDTASSHQRTFIVEVMGRNCGYLALMAGITGGAEVIHIPEIELSLEETLARVEDAARRQKTHAIIVVSEGARHKSQEIAAFLQQRHTGFEVRTTILGHVQRGGRPTHFDRFLATRMGVKAVEALRANQRGVMVGLCNKDMTLIALEEIVGKQPVLPREYDEMAKMLAI
jgi:6-phosphofructokinase 1